MPARASPPGQRKKENAGLFQGGFPSNMKEKYIYMKSHLLRDKSQDKTRRDKTRQDVTRQEPYFCLGKTYCL